MSVLDEIKERIDIVEFIGSSISLRKVGRNYIGFCPFHPNTRTPALVVFPETRSFYCFGCHASGSIFDFVMLQQGLSFAEALEMLARQAGVLLRERAPVEHQREEYRQRLLAITTEAASYFHHLLRRHRGGQPGRDYLKHRGIDLAMVEMFQLGYSLDERNHLLKHLSEQRSFALEDIAATGLIVQHESGEWVDRFRGRIIFPIHNEKGEIVGFGGRMVTAPEHTAASPPKYLNTPRTILFDKGHLLYGWYQARESIRKADTVVVVEGYLDVLTAHQYGFTNVVAPLGTAITARHVALLKRRTRNVILALDGDAAGQQATLRSIHAFRSRPDGSAVEGAEEDHNTSGEEVGRMIGTAHGLVRWESTIALRILRMPPGKDPDEVIRSDPQQWHALVTAAVPVMDFLFDISLADLDLTNPHDQRIALERLLPVLAELEAIPQRVYTARLEQLIGVGHIGDLIRARRPNTHRVGNLSHTYHTSHTSADGMRRGPARTGHPSMGEADRDLVLRGYRAPSPLPQEDHLLALLLHYPKTIQAVEASIAAGIALFPTMHPVLGSTIPQLFERMENRLLWQYWAEAGFPMMSQFRECEGEDVLSAVYSEHPWVSHMPEPLQSQLLHLLSSDLPQPTEQTYLQEACACARMLRIRQVKQWNQQMSQYLREAGESLAAELPQLIALLEMSFRYLCALSTPPHGRWYDLRNALERERGHYH